MNPTTSPRKSAAKRNAPADTPVTITTEELPVEEVNRILGQRLAEAEEGRQSVLTEAQNLHDLLTIANGEREKVFQEKIKLQLEGLAKDRLIVALQAQIETLTNAD